MRPDTAAPTQTHTYLLAEPSLPDLFNGQARLIYIKKENPSLGQKVKDFFLSPLMIIAAKVSLLNVLQGSVFKDNKDAQNLTTHIKGLGFFEGVDEFRVKDFLADAALHGSRLLPHSGTTNKAEKSLALLTSTALKEHLNHPDYMYATLHPRSTNVDYFLAFFQEKNGNLLGDVLKAHALIFKKDLANLADALDPYHEDASMRATLEILADEFLAHASNPEQTWATAEAIKTLSRDLKKYKADEAKYWA